MRIAIIGAGVSGNVAAWLLQREHEIVLFEANDYAGGHTNTVDAEAEGRSWAVDTGFIVFNDWTYPNFIRLLDKLGVASQASSMSFSVRDEASGLEYNGTSANSLFAQRLNLFRPSFHRMIRDILRFNREAPKVLDEPTPADGRERTLGEFLSAGGYGREFVDHYLVPMGAAVWSAEPGDFGTFPLRFFVQFFKNHGFLNVENRPTWRVVSGGSREYVKKLVAPFRDRVRLSSPVESVRRFADRVEVKPRGGEAERFDAVVFAAHSDQALAMLADPSAAERDILGAIPYRPNEALLHRDASILPRKRLAWAAWNYHKLKSDGALALTYNMNILQGLAPKKTTFCVTLNRADAIAPETAMGRWLYHHPVYTTAGMAAQKRRGEISGVNRTYYCGAYWGYGFHEDGVKSALDVGEKFGLSL
jgi:predicted NAD/FAD-binding protein